MTFSVYFMKYETGQESGNDGNFLKCRIRKETGKKGVDYVLYYRIAF
jgi:hypothetical protein